MSCQIHRHVILPRPAEPASGVRLLPQVGKHHVLPESVGARVVEVLLVGGVLHRQALDYRDAERGQPAEIGVTMACLARGQRLPVEPLDLA